ncbi:B-cell receptor CD22-like [Cyprinodon tularosa]|uniref:B-cell receptor CD22-like n=1 Tax=Cyprinodon tularosa TaxID=77115 RepID=UPI0018E260D6|nr:B-cell receptor CD22-like [Cyprinodon tularosa]
MATRTVSLLQDCGTQTLGATNCSTRTLGATDCSTRTLGTHDKEEFRVREAGTSTAPIDLKNDPDYAGRVEYGTGCTVRIRNIGEADSAFYKIRFKTNHKHGIYTGVPGVKLSVSGLKLNVTKSERRNNHNWTEMKCKSSCLPDQHPYIWIKNGQEILAESSSFFSYEFRDKEHISCAAKGYEKFPSPSVYVPKLPSVSLNTAGEILEGSFIILTCTSDANPAATYTWYKKDSTGPLSKNSQLVFRSSQSSDSGEYYCTAAYILKIMTSEVIFIDVKYAPRPPIVSLHSSGDVVEGSSVTLVCSSDANPPAKYTWYKEDEPDPRSKESKLVLKSIQSSDSGKYFCTAQNKFLMMTSKNIIVDVEYAPRLPVVSMIPSGEIKEGMSLTLTCSSDANPAANYSWFNKNEKWPQYSSQNLTIANIGQQHSGLYYCEAINRRGSHKSAIHVTVFATMHFKIMNITKLAVAILLLLILLSLLMRKKKGSSQKTESKEYEEHLELNLDPEYENISTLRAFIGFQKEREKENNAM